MEKTRVIYHKEYEISPVDPRIFGGFLEHLGRAVYEGVFDPSSPHADENGFRKDVLDALRPMRFNAVRYPGGNFASGYHWQNGVGPKENRPTVRDLAWQSLEPNQFGTDEFMTLSHVMEWDPMISVNLGNGGMEEAGNWVEYCNSPVGTQFADMRAANGHSDPYGVKVWFLGNEMDGYWQIGHMPAEQYALKAHQAAQVMKYTDPTIELVAVGSCKVENPTYLDWDRKVLEYVGDYADYISLHRYVRNWNNDTLDYLAVTKSIDRQIEDIDAICRYVQSLHKSKKRAWLCFDEWNIWYRARTAAHKDGKGEFAPHLCEEPFNLEDVLIVAGFMNSFIRHADVVKIANLAQPVNAMGAMLTRGDQLLLQSIYYPFLMYSSRRDGVSLRPSIKGPSYDSPTHGKTKYIDTSAIKGDGKLHVFLSNRNMSANAQVEIEYPGGQLLSVESAEIVTGPSPDAMNTFEQPHIIKSEQFSGIQIASNIANVKLPPLSVVAITFKTD
jgi:alpha-L-arabinofuranosidase